MRRAHLPVLGWAALLTALAGVLYAWTPHAELQWAPLAGAAAGAWLVGLYLLVRRWADGELRLVPDLSFPTVGIALGLATLLDSASFGLWLALIGGGIVLAGLLGIARELVIARRIRRPARPAPGRGR